MTSAPGWRDAAGLGFVSSLGPFVITAYVPGFYEIAAEFGASFVAVQQSMTAYLAGFAAAALFVGALSDAFGRKPVLTGGMLLVIAATLAALASDSFLVFNVCRVFQGMGAAVGQVVTLALVRDRWQGLDAAKMNGLVAMFFAVAPAVAPVVGGELVVHWGWRAVYVFIAAYAAAVAISVTVFLTETLPQEKRRPFRPGALAAGYRRVLLSGPFMAGAAAHGFAFMGGILYSAGAADFVVKVMGLRVDEFGWLTVPLVVSGIAGSWASPRLAARWGAAGMLRRVTIAMIFASAAAALADWIWAPGFPRVLLGPALYYFAMSADRPVLQVLNLDFFPENRGTAASVQQFFATGSFAACTGFWVPLVMGSAARYALVMTFCAVMVLCLSFVLLKGRR